MATNDETQPAPLPWKVFTFSSATMRRCRFFFRQYRRLIVAANGNVVADVRADSDEEAKTVAGMIGAAPDLAEALKRIAYSAHADTAPTLRGYAQEALEVLAAKTGGAK